MQTTPPKDIDELLSRANLLAGTKLNIPDNQNHAKGLVGQLIEQHLGATGGSRAVVDFPHLGVELKTLPVNNNLTPIESTYVCTVQANNAALSWQTSWVYQKLKQVLWLPIQNNIVLKPIFWQMDLNAENILKTDWEELMELLSLGYGKQLTAKYGTYLHIRPKAANSRTLVNYQEADGAITKIVPRGFYLRSSFTKNILNSNIAK